MTEQGGIGKTSLCFNLGWYLAEQGKRVLLIDLDSQRGNMTFYAGIENKEELFGIYDMAINEKYTISNSRQEISPNLHIVIGNNKTTMIHDIATKKGLNLLKEMLDKIKHEYDYIFIDTSPTPSLIHAVSLIASDHIIIPSGIDGKSIEATLGILESYEVIKKEYNKDLTVLAVVINKASNRKTNVKKIIEPAIYALSAVTKVKFAKIRIPDNTDIDQVTIVKRGVTNFSPRSSGAKSIKELSKELFNV